MPFIQGPRNCLGQFFALLEARVVLALLVKVRRLASQGSGCWPRKIMFINQIRMSTCVIAMQRFKFRNVRRDAGERHPLVRACCA